MSNEKKGRALYLLVSEISQDFGGIQGYSLLAPHGMLGGWHRKHDWGVREVVNCFAFILLFFFFNGKMYSLQNVSLPLINKNDSLYMILMLCGITWVVPICSRQLELEHKSTGSGCWVWIAAVYSGCCQWANCLVILCLLEFLSEIGTYFHEETSESKVLMYTTCLRVS